MTKEQVTLNIESLVADDNTKKCALQNKRGVDIVIYASITSLLQDLADEMTKHTLGDQLVARICIVQDFRDLGLVVIHIVQCKDMYVVTSQEA